MNLHQKLIEIRKGVPYLQKATKNQQQGFMYTGSSQVLAAVKTKMDELGVLLVPEITGHKFHEKSAMTVVRPDGKTQSGAQHVTELDLTMTWVDAEKPSDTIKCTWYAQGVDQHEKGIGKAMTYAEKYFILKFFNIPTDHDDPDAFEEKAKSGGGDVKTTLPKTKGAGSKKPVAQKQPPAGEKPLNAVQVARLVHMGQQLDEPLSSGDVQGMINSYCAEHGGQTHKNGEYIKAHFQEVLDNHINKKTGDG